MAGCFGNILTHLSTLCVYQGQFVTCIGVSLKLSNYLLVTDVVNDGSQLVDVKWGIEVGDTGTGTSISENYLNSLSTKL